MQRHRVVAAVSAAQLAFGLAGLALAVRRRHAFDILGWRGSRERVGRDAAWIGTALSAPAPMLAAQLAATVVVAQRDDRTAERTLAWLGLAMVGGCCVERHVRLRLSRRGWDRLESPVAVGGLTLAAAMAAVGGMMRTRSG